MELPSRALLLFLGVLSVSKLSAAVIVCEPRAGPQSVTVGPNERVVYTSKNYPSAYPQGYCDVTFFPATANTKLVLIFEDFHADLFDKIDFYANVTDSPGSTPKLEIVRVVGPYWSKDFRYPENITQPTLNFSGIIDTRFTARSDLVARGFVAHIIGYDMSKPLNECRSEMTTLKAGESFLAVSTGAPFNSIAPATCEWSVKPADANTLLKVTVNYVSLMNGQVLVSTFGLPTVNISGIGNSSENPQLILDNITNQIDFKFSKLGEHDDGIFSYSIVVNAFTVEPLTTASSSLDSSTATAGTNQSQPTAPSGSSLTSTTSSPLTSSAPSISMNSFTIALLFFCASAFVTALL